MPASPARTDCRPDAEPRYLRPDAGAMLSTGAQCRRFGPGSPPLATSHAQQPACRAPSPRARASAPASVPVVMLSPALVVTIALVVSPSSPVALAAVAAVAGPVIGVSPVDALVESCSRYAGERRSDVSMDRRP